MKTDEYTRVWVVFVQKKGFRANRWGPTGRDWFRTRRECQDEIDSLSPELHVEYRYRPEKYVPAAEER